MHHKSIEEQTSVSSVWKGEHFAMTRQCAWCLRLMDHQGEWLSLQPVQKIYEATHGMCRSCGMLWLEQALLDTDEQPALNLVFVAKELNYRC